MADNTYRHQSSMTSEALDDARRRHRVVAENSACLDQVGAASLLQNGVGAGEFFLAD